jgi:hypothetical protein
VNSPAAVDETDGRLSNPQLDQKTAVTVRHRQRIEAPLIESVSLWNMAGKVHRRHQLEHNQFEFEGASN